MLTRLHHGKLSIYAFAFVVVAGCNRQSADDSFRSNRDAMWERVNAKSDAEQAEKLKIVAEEARTMLPASTKEELAKAYQIAFDRGDITALEQMALFKGDITDELRERFLVQLGVLKAGESHISDHSFQPLTEGDEYRYAGQNVEAMLAVDATSNDDSGGSSFKLPVVMSDGSCFFLFRYVEPGNDDEE